MSKDNTRVSDFFEIPEENLPAFMKKVERLQKRIEKMGVEDAWLSADPVGRNMKPTGNGTFRRYIEVYVYAEMVKLGDYTFVARLRHDKKAGPMIQAAPGQTVPQKYFNAHSDCDHCKTNRFRKDTFILLNNETNEHIQVGRTCIRDFLGHDVEHLAKLAELIVSFHTIASQFSGDMAPYENYMSTEEYLAYVVRVLRQRAWVSKSKAYDHNMGLAADDVHNLLTPTSEDAYNEFLQVHGFNKQVTGQYATEEELETARKVIEFWKTQDGSSSEYVHNCTVIANSPHINHRDTGFAASMVNGWMKEQAKNESVKKLNLDASKHFGSIKDRVTVKLEVIWSKDMVTSWGNSTLTKGITEDGNAVTIWNGNWSKHPQKGDVVTVKGTIKGHDEYKGVKSTVLNRVKEV